MRRSATAALALALATVVLGACGSSAKTSAPSSTTPTELFSSPSYEKAKPTPSASARMVCEKEGQVEIAAALGVKGRVATPTWNKQQHLYSCTYAYPNGKIVLSVKEMSSADETTAYFNSITKKFGTGNQLIGLGQGAWVLKNSDAVVRKDYKVLLVNVAGIPARFSPLLRRSDASTSIAAVIMGCWKGN
jgi:hypothetical protein